MTGSRPIKAITTALKLSLAVALFGLGAAPAQAAIGITSLTSSPSTTQAGAHPNFSFSVRVCDPAPANCDPEQNSSRLDELVVRLPPGMLGNPAAIPVCPSHLWQANACPPESQVGESTSIVEQDSGFVISVPTRLFNVDTVGLEPARLGTEYVPGTPPGPLPIQVTLDSAGDFSIDSAIEHLPLNLGGVPATIQEIQTTLFSHVAGRPFFVNPTSCDNLSMLEVEVTSYPFHNPSTGVTFAPSRDAAQTSVFNAGATPIPPTGCDAVPFDLNVNATPDSNRPGEPTGYTVNLEYPDFTDAPIWQSQLKDAIVKLPEQVTLAAAGGVGLEACTAEQFGVDAYATPGSPARVNNNPVRCPEGSDIGDVSVETPVLANGTTSTTAAGGKTFVAGDDAIPDLSGDAFFGPTSGPGRPTADRPWKLFLLLEGFGVRVKLIGDVTVDSNGRVTTTFLNQPEVPFNRFTLHTNGGPNAVLQNPRDCGPHSIEAEFRGWKDAHNPAAPLRHSVGTFTIGDGGPCPEPFQPEVEDAAASPTQAGAESISHLVINRPDNHQIIRRLKLALPPGAAGSLATVPLCPRAQARTGDCGVESRVGTIKTTVGQGRNNLSASGSLYLGEPVEGGDAASFVIVVPAKVGPIDLGRVVVVNRVRLRPSDTGIDVLSADIPTILEGIPLPVQRIEITVDREHFFINPTGCDRRLFVADFTGDRGAGATANFPTQATGCNRLRFAPKLRLIAGGRGLTKKDAHPPLKAIVTQQKGEANISRARVVLPDIIRPNVPQFQRPGALCNDAQLARRACPPLSQVGTARVTSPLLPFQLSGPVFIVLEAGKPLPKLAVFLRGGGLEVVLNASNGFEGIKILNTFDAVPDVPQSFFELSIKGGKDGILLNHSDLCTTRPLPRIDATFRGHNGKTSSTKPRLESAGCSTAGVAISSTSARMSKGGIVRVAVRCRGRMTCSGRLSLRNIGSKSFRVRGGKSKVVKVKASRKARRAVRRQKRMRVRASARLRGVRIQGATTSATKTITVRAPRR